MSSSTFTQLTINDIVKDCNLKRLKMMYLYDQPPNELYIQALRYGKHLVIQWLSSRGCELPKNLHEDVNKIYMDAIEQDNITTIHWLFEKGYELPDEMCRKAGKFGRVNILQWAIDNGCKWDRQICIDAVCNNHLPILEFAFERDLLWKDIICSTAAIYGRVTILEWARSNDCPWGETCLIATITQNLEILLWARTNGCPNDSRIHDFAKRIDYEWIHNLRQLDTSCITPNDKYYEFTKVMETDESDEYSVEEVD